MKQQVAGLILGLFAGLGVNGVEGKMSEMGEKGRLIKESGWNANVESGKWPRLGLKSAFKVAQSCNNTADESGVVEINGEAFPCSNVDFLSFIALSDLFIEINGGTTLSSDIWGWEDPVTRQEITLHCVDNGLWYVDSTDPVNPVRMAVTDNPASKYAWCDVKTYNNTAYIVRDRSSENEFDQTYGIQVVDLNRLRNIDPADFPIQLEPDTVYAGHGRSHNLAVDTETGFLFSIGSTTCAGGPHMLDLKPDPLNPTFAGCVDGDGYTHDAQCVVYDGPDTRFTGREICFAYNEDTLTIWDVTEKDSPIRVSRTGYDTAVYTHQGWLTDDMKYVLLNDELDEEEAVQPTTTTYIVDVSDLRRPEFVSTFVHDDVSIDHNLYVWGAVHKKGWGGSVPYSESTWLFPEISTRFAYLSNYVAGLRVIDLQGFPQGTQAGFFDCAPDLDGNIFEGTWSNYMHPSGTIALSSIDRGLFFVRFNNMYEELVQTDAPTIVPTTPTFTDSPTVLPTSAPIVCIDQVPTGLTFSATGEPAECVDLPDYCTLELVFSVCPVTCGLCVPNPTISPSEAPTMRPTSSPVVEDVGAGTGDEGSDDDDLDSEDLLFGIAVVLGLIAMVLGIMLFCRDDHAAAAPVVEDDTKRQVNLF